MSSPRPEEEQVGVYDLECEGGGRGGPEEEKGRHSRLVGERLNKQGNLHTRLTLSLQSDWILPPAPARISKV